MNDYSAILAPKDVRPDTTSQGVRGWLLVLCLMLTVVGPIISVWLMAHEYGNSVRVASGSPSGLVAVIGSLLLTACAVAFGAYAGLRLWRVQPKAVKTAKLALLFGVVVDIVTTAIEAATAEVPSDQLLFQVKISVMPSLIFFTLCFAYLNRSKRVYNTYESHRTGV